MSIDIEEMVRMASSPRRQMWKVNEYNPFEVILPPEGESGDLVCMHYVCTVNRGMPESVAFIANAPRAITALHQRVQDLEAQVAALQAQVGVFEEKQREAYQLGRRHAIAGEMVQYMDARPLPDESATAAESEE